MDNPKYVSNNIYTGIYLINYSISRNYNVDIHDEMLKRKEYELFRINHTKKIQHLIVLPKKHILIL